MPVQVATEAEAAAKRMIARYGNERALEYAYGYAVGVYFQQTEYGRQYWLTVCDIIERETHGIVHSVR